MIEGVVAVYLVSIVVFGAMVVILSRKIDAVIRQFCAIGEKELSGYIRTWEELAIMEKNIEAINRRIDDMKKETPNG